MQLQFAFEDASKNIHDASFHAMEASECAVQYRGLIPLRHPHILSMTTWQKTYARETPKTKAELREMLTEAVRNTRAELTRAPKAEEDGD
jgi:hypothetical protein